MGNTSSFVPGTTGGNREEFITDPLTLLEPEDTPFVSLINKPNISSTYPEALGDRMRAPTVSGSREGWSGDKGNNKALKRARFGVYPHRWHDEYGVSDVQEAVSKRGGNAATNDEYGDAAAKCLREVKRDIEAVLLSHQDCQAASAGAMRTRGAFKWLDSSQTPAVAPDFQPDDTNATLTGQATMTEALLNQMLKSMKSVHGGSRDYAMFAGNDYVEDIDWLTRTGASNERFRVTQDVTNHEVVVMVNVFQTSFGRLKVFPHEFLRCDQVSTGDTDALIICRLPLWEFGTLEDLAEHDNPEDAGGQSGYVKAIGALMCRSPRGNAYCYNA
jgi:hypothetical protein